MNIADTLSDQAVLRSLGERLERQRIEASLTQAELAEEAGVSKRTLERIEAGRGCELEKLIRVLRVLKLAEGFNALIPELPPSPMAQLKLRGKQRRRVAHPRTKTRRSSPSMSSSPNSRVPPPRDPAVPSTPPVPTPSHPSPRKPWTWGK